MFGGPCEMVEVFFPSFLRLVELRHAELVVG